MLAAHAGGTCSFFRTDWTFCSSSIDSLRLCSLTQTEFVLSETFSAGGIAGSERRLSRNSSQERPPTHHFLQLFHIRPHAICNRPQVRFRNCSI